MKFIAALTISCASAIKYRPPVGSVPWHKANDEISVASWVNPDKKEYPTNYFVPDFGVDFDIADTQKHQAQAEEAVGFKMTTTWKKEKGPPMDYYVPNFGVDQDIKDLQENLHETEHKLGKWKIKTDDWGNVVVPEAADNASYYYKV